jgi:hypothetical protein
MILAGSPVGFNGAKVNNCELLQALAIDRMALGEERLERLHRM